MFVPAVRRSGPTILMVSVLVVAAVVALGLPDAGLIRSFMGGTSASDQGAVAVAGLVTWVVIAVAVLATVTDSFRSVASTAQFVRRRWARAIVLAVTGGVLLGVGFAHHTATGFSMCCGSIEEAQQTLGR